VVDPGAGPKSQLPLELRMAKVLADPLRVKILLETHARSLSPKQFLEEFGGGSLPRVSRHFDVLVEYGWLELVETKSGGSRRGAVEHFYRATRPTLFDSSWPSLPDSMRDRFNLHIFETFAAEVRAAMDAGTFDARDDRHLSWTPVLLDRSGWDNVVSRVDEVFHFLFEEQTRAKERMDESGEEPISTTVGLAVFESPRDLTKAP
jgi:DNA-binding transcriptional ArsR family regulator